MLQVRHLEMHVAHACNLSCDSCAHYSNHGHGGVVSLEDADRWMGEWSGRIAPATFTLLGGEPTIHPRLPEFFELARRHWPDASLRLVTNGAFLHRHPDLPLVMKRVERSHIQLSVHHDDPVYTENLAPVWELLSEWGKTHQTKISSVDSHKRWTRRYNGYGADMAPFAEGNPRGSWENCTAKTSPQLFEGALWKCAALAYLPMQDAKFGLSEAWRPYLGYEPLRSGCSDAELAAFFAREDEPVCGMCPTAKELMSLPVPDFKVPVVRAKSDEADAQAAVSAE